MDRNLDGPFGHPRLASSLGVGEAGDLHVLQKRTLLVRKRGDKFAEIVSRRRFVAVLAGEELGRLVERLGAADSVAAIPVNQLVTRYGVRPRREGV